MAKSVAYFADQRVVATASNVNIKPNGTLLGMIQRFEYLICHQMKKAHSALQRRVHHRRDRVDIPA